jgi:O-antigen/teichoic acid export membrane protein
MGFAAVFLAVATIAATAGTMRLELLVPTAKLGSLRWLVRTATTLLACVGLVTALSMMLAGGFDALEGLLLTTTIVAMGLVAITMQLSARTKAFKGVAIAKGGQGILQGGSQVLFGVSSMTTYGMPIGYALAYLGTSIIQSISYRRTRIPQPGQRIDGGERTRMVHRALALTGAALINVTAVSLLPLITQYFFGDRATGELSVAQRLAIAPAGLLVAALVPVVASNFGELIRDGQPVTRAIWKWIVRLLPLGLALGLALIAVPADWLRVFLGEGWDDVKAYLVALALAVSVQVVAGPLGQLLALQGRVKTQFAWDAARLLALISTTSIVATATNDPVLTTFAGACVLAIFYVAFVLILVIPGGPARSRND